MGERKHFALLAALAPQLLGRARGELTQHLDQGLQFHHPMSLLILRII